MRTRNFRKIYEGNMYVAVCYMDTLTDALDLDREYLDKYPSQGFIRYIPADAKLGGL